MVDRNQDPGPVGPTPPLSFHLRMNSKWVRLHRSLGAIASYTATDSVISFGKGAQCTRKRNIIIAASSIHNKSLSMIY